MNKKSELCVRINNKITPTCKSFVGVKQGDVLSPNLLSPRQHPSFRNILVNTLESTSFNGF